MENILRKISIQCDELKKFHVDTLFIALDPASVNDIFTAGSDLGQQMIEFQNLIDLFKKHRKIIHCLSEQQRQVNEISDLNSSEQYMVNIADQHHDVDEVMHSDGEIYPVLESKFGEKKHSKSKMNPTVMIQKLDIARPETRVSPRKTPVADSKKKSVMESKKKATKDSRKTPNSKKKLIVEEVDDLDMSLECMNEVDAKELEKEIKYFQASDAPDAPVAPVLDVENQYVEATDEETFVVKCDPDEAAYDATDGDTKGVADNETTDVKNFLDEIPLEMDSRSGDDAADDNEDATDIDDTIYDNNASDDEIETDPTRPSTSSGKKSKIVEIVPEEAQRSFRLCNSKNIISKWKSERRNLNRKTSVLCDVAKLGNFLARHPKSRRIYLPEANFSLKTKQNLIVRVTSEKFMEECGTYPSIEDKITLSRVLGDLLDQSPLKFYDEKKYKGSIEFAIQNIRRKLKNNNHTLSSLVNDGASDYMELDDIQSAGSNCKTDITETAEQFVFTTASFLGSVESLQRFLSLHPSTAKYFNGQLTCSLTQKRVMAQRVASLKLIEEYGPYPSSEDKTRLSVLMGDLFDQLPSVFFDPNSHTGYINRVLDNYRRKNSERCKKWLKPVDGVDYSHNKSNEFEDEENVGPASLKCKDCNKAFEKLFLLKTHMIRVHQYNVTYACQSCREVFATKSEFFNHNEACRIEERLLTNGVSHTCRICGISLSSTETLLLHFRNDHSDMKPFKCLRCYEEFSTKFQLNSHDCSVTSNAEFLICEECGEGLSSKKLLISHMCSCHGHKKPFTCSNCDKSFSLKGQLVAHLMMHERIKANVPFECGKSFVTEKAQKSHRRKHSKERPYTCQYCGRSFASNGGLNIHLPVHTGEKPWKCNICYRSFSNKWYLIDHVRTHTGEKPYKCKTCHKTFAQRCSRNQHSKLHKTST